MSGPRPAQRLLFVADAAVAEVSELPRTARALTVLGHMHSIGAHARGLAGRSSVMTVIADAVADFEPNHILLALRSPEHANWQEHRLGEHVKERFGLPLTTYAIDPCGHVPTA